MTNHEAEARKVAEEISVRLWGVPYMADMEKAVLPFLLAFAQRVRGPLFKDIEEWSHLAADKADEIDSLRAQLAEAQANWAHAAAGYYRQPGCDAYKQAAENAYSSCRCPQLPVVARMAELLCADCDRRIREDEAALSRRAARTPEPKDPLSISYVAVTRGREWPRPEHKREWNQEQDDSWCSYCHVQWPCDEAKP